MGKILKLSLVCWLLPFNAVAEITDVWDRGYLEPCDCRGSLEEAIPQVLSNHSPLRQNAVFNEILPNLIRAYAFDTSVPAAEKGIFWTVYELGSQDIVNALIEAKAAGLRVELITDGKSILNNPEGAVDPSRSFQRELLFDAYRRLRAAGVRVVYSNPDWNPSGNLYPRIMHEKIRIFARKIRSRWRPLFAYVSTHNDTYSEMLGDPLESLSPERMREGHLLSTELLEGSRGNVQTSFIVRNVDLLKELWTNYQAQAELYGQGRGNIKELTPRPPLEISLGDGTKIVMAFTFGRRSAFNPNERQAKFITDLATDPELNTTRVRLTQFVFTYGKVEDALKVLAQSEAKPIEAIVDARAAFEAYTQARAMAGLFSVTDYRPGNYIDYPWKKDLRKKIFLKTYSHKHDRLHLKNSYIRYRRGDEPVRFRIYTGSLNLSSNGSANKEVAFEIDTPSTHFARVMENQWNQLQTEGSLYNFADEALLSRLKGVGQRFGVRIENAPEARASLQSFLTAIGQPNLPDIISAPFVRPEWMSSLGEFYGNVGASALERDRILNDVDANLQQVNRFYPSLSNLEVFLNLSQKADMLPSVRAAILRLFTTTETPRATDDPAER